jgi:hypothetical protein
MSRVRVQHAPGVSVYVTLGTGNQLVRAELAGDLLNITDKLSVYERDSLIKKALRKIAIENDMKGK